MDSQNSEAGKRLATIVDEYGGDLLKAISRSCEEHIRGHFSSLKVNCLSVIPWGDFRRIVVAMDRDTLFEAVYVDGEYHSCDQTIYAGVIATIADGNPFILVHRNVEPVGDNEWPKKESELIDVVEE